MIRQGRNQEALSEFQKVIEKRGLLNAPEAHLELGLLYQSHMRDPISAIYHFKKYRELKPSTQQAVLVNARIDAAIREFASTLPGRPLENPLTPADNFEVVQRLQRENEQLQTRVTGLESELVRLSEIERENARLQELLNLRAHLEGTAYGARVIARDPGPLSMTLTIDRGERDNVHRGMAVIAPLVVDTSMSSPKPDSADRARSERLVCSLSRSPNRSKSVLAVRITPRYVRATPIRISAADRRKIDAVEPDTPTTKLPATATATM